MVLNRGTLQSKNKHSQLNMKTLIRSVLGLLVTAIAGFAGQELTDVSFALGPKWFQERDHVIIEQVQATSTNLTVGDTVVVRGRYELKSYEEARLCLYLTAREGAGEPDFPTQSTIINKGSGEFQLSEVVRHTGHLHVSLYRVSDGKDFACVYFGTPKQMAEIKDWKIGQ